MTRRYRYLGDRATAPELRGMRCTAIERDGRCIRGRNASMLVAGEDGRRYVVLGRRLRRENP